MQLAQCNEYLVSIAGTDGRWTHWGLVTPYGDIDDIGLDQHWLR